MIVLNRKFDTDSDRFRIFKKRRMFEFYKKMFEKNKCRVNENLYLKNIYI